MGLTPRRSAKGHGKIIVSNIIWIIVIGFIVGIIAHFLAPGPNNLNGFILTTGLGIASAFVATFGPPHSNRAQPPTPARRRAAGSKDLQDALVKSVRWACKRFVATTDSIEAGHSGGRHGTARYLQWHAEWPSGPTSAQH
jgi:hypothetical protein